MRSRRFSIHLSESYNPMAFPNIVLMSNLFLIFHHKFHQVMHFDTLAWYLMNLKLLLFCVLGFFSFCRVNKQINKLLVIELEETNTNQIFFWSGCILDGFKDISNWTRHYSLQLYIIISSSTLHSEGFASTCLTISKNSSIISFEHTLDNWKSSLFKDWRLLAIRCKCCIVGEISGWRLIDLLRMRIFDCDLSVSFIYVDNKLMLSF